MLLAHAGSETLHSMSYALSNISMLYLLHNAETPRRSRLVALALPHPKLVTANVLGSALLDVDAMLRAAGARSADRHAIYRGTRSASSPTAARTPALLNGACAAKGLRGLNE